MSNRKISEYIVEIYGKRYRLHEDTEQNIGECTPANCDAFEICEKMPGCGHNSHYELIKDDQ